MPYLETNDRTRLYYQEWGSGPPVVFLASWGLSCEMWEYQMLPLSYQGLRCIAYDRRGHGRSDDPGRGYDFDTLAGDLAALLDHLDLREVTLVGHSMGCTEIARFMACHGVSRLSRAALVSSAFMLIQLPQETVDAAREQAISSLIQDRPRYFAEGTIKFFGLGSTWPQPPSISPEMIEWGNRLILAASPRALIDCWRAMWQADFGPDISAFTVPTLVIHGDNDRNAPPELCGQPTAQAIQGSRYIVYEGAAHGLFLTHRERLAADLLAFARSDG